MEVLGRFAGGIAHDFNNALTSIVGGSGLLRDRFIGPRARSDLEAILRAGQRAALLTRSLLAFGRHQTLRIEVCSLAELVERTVALLERTLEHRIDLETRIHRGSWPVRVDAVQLEPVIMNLAVNARDAMPVGGALVLAASAEEALDAPEVSAGTQDLLVIALSLPGMADGELADHMQSSDAGPAVPFLSGHALGGDIRGPECEPTGVKSGAGGRVRARVELPPGKREVSDPQRRPAASSPS